EPLIPHIDAVRRPLPLLRSERSVEHDGIWTGRPTWFRLRGTIAALRHRWRLKSEQTHCSQHRKGNAHLHCVYLTFGERAASASISSVKRRSDRPRCSFAKAVKRPCGSIWPLLTL